jgi:ABC-type uncharacterized transport system auxiliary subunit
MIRLFLTAVVCLAVLSGCSKRAEPKSGYSLTLELTDIPAAPE